MSAQILAGVLWKVAGLLINQLEAKAAKCLTEDSLLYKAIRSTSEAFPEMVGVSDTLERWCESNAFRQMVKQLAEGQRELTNDEMARNFVEATGFYFGDQTTTKALELLKCFLNTIEELLYASDNGLAFHATRQEVLHAGTVDKIDALQESMSLISAQIAQYTSSKAFLPSDDLGKNPQVKEKILHAKIDQARDLIKDGKPSSARLILKRLRDELTGGSPSAELTFRITTNLGVCALHLDENETAISEFRDALLLQPNSAKALSNGSIAALLEGNLEEALTLSKRARAIEPKDSIATTVLIQALHELSHREELKSLLATEDWMAEDPACSCAIGDLSLKDGDFQGAEKVLRDSIAKGNRNPNLLILLGKVIFDPILKGLREDAPLRWRMSPKVIKSIEEGEQLLDEAVESLSGQENRGRLHDALASRGGIRCVLGKADEGIEDCDRVLGENKSHLTALHNKALILFSQEKFNEAIPVAEAVLSKSEDDGLAIMLASAYAATNSHAKAISVLEPLWHHESRGTDRIEIASILARQYSLVGNLAGAAEVIRLLAESRPHDPDALVIRARELRINKKYQEALSLLESMPATATGSVRDRVALERAELHFSTENYSAAAKILGEIVDKIHDNPLTRKYIVCLYNSQQFQEALHAARAVRSVEGVKPEISEIEALILESVGDLPAASQLWCELGRHYPENVKYRLALARLDFRSGNRDSARNRLSAIGFDEIKDDAEALIQVAQERTLLGMSGVLPLVYRARQIDFGNPAVHLAYFSCFFSREELEESSLTPVVVGADCVVHLKREAESLTFTILGDESADRSRNELSISDGLATKLLGHRKGDQVLLKNAPPFEKLSYEIIEVQSKYVYAFQQSLNEFTTRFSDHPGFFRMEFKENDFSQLLMAIDKRHEFITQLTLLYQQNGLPLSTMSKVAGTRVVEVWAGMMGWQNGRIRTALGSLEERNIAESAVIGAQEVVLDMVSLLTMRYLELLDRLPKRFSKLLVPQAVLDEISLTLAGNVLGGRPSGTLGKSGDRYFHREITSDELVRGRKFLEGIRDFVESSTEIMPVPSLLEVAPERIESLRQILPECAVASVLAAKERSTILFSDDLGLRQIAESEWNVKGVWVQPVLADLVEHNAITKDEYQDALQQLILANYFFVSINDKDILRLLNKNGWDISQEIARVFATLNAPDCDEGPAIALIADLTRGVWLEPMMDHQRQIILDLGLNALTTNRLSARVILKLKVELNRRFALLPIQLQAVMQTIHLWQRQHVTRRGLVR